MNFMQGKEKGRILAREKERYNFERKCISIEVFFKTRDVIEVVEQHITIMSYSINFLKDSMH